MLSVGATDPYGFNLSRNATQESRSHYRSFFPDCLQAPKCQDWPSAVRIRTAGAAA